MSSVGQGCHSAVFFQFTGKTDEKTGRKKKFDVFRTVRILELKPGADGKTIIKVDGDSRDGNKKKCRHVEKFDQAFLNKNYQNALDAKRGIILQDKDGKELSIEKVVNSPTIDLLLKVLVVREDFFVTEQMVRQVIARLFADEPRKADDDDDKRRLVPNKPKCSKRESVSADYIFDWTEPEEPFPVWDKDGNIQDFWVMPTSDGGDRIHVISDESGSPKQYSDLNEFENLNGKTFQTCDESEGIFKAELVVENNKRQLKLSRSQQNKKN